MPAEDGEPRRRRRVRGRRTSRRQSHAGSGPLAVLIYYQYPRSRMTRRRQHHTAKVGEWGGGNDEAGHNRWCIQHHTRGSHTGSNTRSPILYGGQLVSSSNQPPWPNGQGCSGWWGHTRHGRPVSVRARCAPSPPPAHALPFRRGRPSPRAARRHPTRRAPSECACVDAAAPPCRWSVAHARGRQRRGAGERRAHARAPRRRDAPSAAAARARDQGVGAEDGDRTSGLPFKAAITDLALLYRPETM